jgi:hypothetical protein
LPLIILRGNCFFLFWMKSFTKLSHLTIKFRQLVDKIINNRVSDMIFFHNFFVAQVGFNNFSNFSNNIVSANRWRTGTWDLRKNLNYKLIARYSATNRAILICSIHDKTSKHNHNSDSRLHFDEPDLNMNCADCTVPSTIGSWYKYLICAKKDVKCKYKWMKITCPAN